MRHPQRRPDLLLTGLAAALAAVLALAPVPARASSTGTTPSTAAKTSTATKPSTGTKPSTVKKATTGSKPSAGTKTPAKATTPARTAPRTLDEVHIEGELDVPEVLFITARDQRRILGFQQRRYLRDSREIARRTPLPSHLIVDHETPAPPTEAPR